MGVKRNATGKSLPSKIHLTRPSVQIITLNKINVLLYLLKVTVSSLCTDNSLPTALTCHFSNDVVNRGTWRGLFSTRSILKEARHRLSRPREQEEGFLSDNETRVATRDTGQGTQQCYPTPRQCIQTFHFLIN